ncbi:hypothetical protein [Desulfonatronum thiodismutans]|uniref:hypothetical protein n=1 Tax=Desulfonatronum thiodismutans TaxID=159290 RepID=UPI0004ABE440|nr:hypothetical protein [Desulfonatronum thiodismutans]
MKKLLAITILAVMLCLTGLVMSGEAQARRVLDEQTIQFAQDEITTFLSQRPESADTLEGIHRWWIRWPGLPESPVITEMALERLENLGVVERLLVGNSVIWRARRL